MCDTLCNIILLSPYLYSDSLYSLSLLLHSHISIHIAGNTFCAT